MWPRVLTVGAVVLGAAILGLFVVLLAFGKAYRMPSSSMEPTFHCSRPAPGCEAGTADRFIVLTFLGWGRGDTVAFRTPQAAQVRCGAGGTYVKRVIGLPGEVVSERQGRLFVDGEALDEPYLAAGRRDAEPPHTWRRLGDGQYFLVGDNRSQSCDSRVFGPVSKSAVIGKVAFVYWPLGRLGSR
jgi:signal peptidase I